MTKSNMTMMDDSKTVQAISSRPKLREFDEFVEEADGLVWCYEGVSDLSKSIRTIYRGAYGDPGVAVRTIDGDHKAGIQRIEDAIERYDSAADDRKKWGDYLEEKAEKFTDEDGLLKSYVSMQVATLLGAFTATKIGNPEVFVPLLIEEIRATDATWYELESACRKLRRTSKTAPSIAAVLEALAEEGKEWGVRREAISGNAYAVKELRKIQANLEEEVHKAEEARLERERKAAEEKRLAEEQRLAEEARLADEARAREGYLAALARYRDEQRRLGEEPLRQYRAQQAEWEQKKRDGAEASDLFSIGDHVWSRSGPAVVVAINGGDVTVEMPDEERKSVFFSVLRKYFPIPVSCRVTHHQFGEGTVIGHWKNCLTVNFDEHDLDRHVLPSFLDLAEL